MGICSSNKRIIPSNNISNTKLNKINNRINQNWNIKADLLSKLLLKDNLFEIEIQMYSMCMEDFNCIDNNNMNLLMYAIIGEKLKIANQLINLINENVINIRHKQYGVTTLWYACNKNYEDLALKILDKTNIDFLKLPKKKYYDSDELNLKISPLYEAKKNNMNRLIIAIKKKISNETIFDSLSKL